jgi:hypothetical protein
VKREVRGQKIPDRHLGESRTAPRSIWHFESTESAPQFSRTESPNCLRFEDLPEGLGERNDAESQSCPVLANELSWFRTSGSRNRHLTPENISLDWYGLRSDVSGFDLPDRQRFNREFGGSGHVVTSTG